MTAVDLDVLVIGAGPSGLALSAELERLGVDVDVVDRRADGGAGSRAIGVHGPSLAALEPSGATERILEHAARITRGEARAHGRVLGEVRFDRLDARFPFVASLPQAVTEEALRAAAPRPRWRTRAVAVSPDGSGATTRLVAASGGQIEVRSRAVVVATGSGGRELTAPFTRPQARACADAYLMADIDAAPTQPSGLAIIDLHHDGVVESFPLPSGGRRLVAWNGTSRALSPAERRDALRHAVATRTGDHLLADRIHGATAFGIRRILLRRMRFGRVFAIGDAAHEVSPIGGQGMNLGLLDAVSLAPHLAAWLRRPETTTSVDRWESRRLASARTAARLAGANTALGRGGSARVNRALTVVIGSAMRTALPRVAARAYGMGFDRDAA